MTDEMFPPLPEPKYGLLKPQPLNNQKVSDPGATDITSQEERNPLPSTTAPSEKDADTSHKPTQKTTHIQQSTAPTGFSILGYDIQTNEPVMIPQASRREGLYLIGIPGTGKTGLIENLIIQDIKQGMGVGLLDPHGDLINAVLERVPDRRVKDVIYLDITDYRSPFGLNLFACSDLTNPIEVQKTVDQVMHIFERLFEITRTTPLIIQYLRNCTHTLIANPGYTMADIPLLLRNKACRHKLIARVRDRNVLGFWQEYEELKPNDQRIEREPILRRLEELLQPLTFNIVGQSTTTVDIRQVMNEGKILLVKLSAQLDSITSLIGSILIALFLNAAYSRTDLPANKRRQFNLYADEFQRFATEDFSTILVEARKYGLATTVAHQTRFQPGMTDGIRATSLGAKNLVVFKVNSKDADELAGEFDITPQQAWEEELEEEWVEVVTPQRHERIEEQVEVEVEDDIKEISQNPVDFLLSARGTHGSKTVREITQNLLSPLMIKLENDKETKQMINQLLVDVMEGRLQTETIAFAERLYALKLWQSISSYTYNHHGIEMGENMRKELLQILVLGHDDFDAYLKQLIKKFTNGLIIDPYINMAYMQSYNEQLGRWVVEEWDKVAETHRPRPDIESKIERLSREIAIQTDEEIDRQYAERIKKLLDEIAYETREERSRYDTYHAFRQCIQDQFMAIVSFYSKFIVLCEELKREPILVPTGKKRLVKRIEPRITYLTHESEKITHPRVAIMHPQRTYADMHNEVASQLTNLGNFVARVRYKNADERLVECIIKTLDPKKQPDKPLFGQALQARLDSIKEQNMQNGYLRKRTDVEEEIRQRQEQCSKPTEDEPPISRRPR